MFCSLTSYSAKLFAQDLIFLDSKMSQETRTDSINGLSHGRENDLCLIEEATSRVQSRKAVLCRGMTRLPLSFSLNFEGNNLLSIEHYGVWDSPLPDLFRKYENPRAD